MVVLLATGGYDSSLRFWDAASGVCYRTLQNAQANCLQFTGDKQFIASGGNGTIKLYDVSSKNPEPLVTYEGHTGKFVVAAAFSMDSQRWLDYIYDFNFRCTTIPAWPPPPAA